MEEKETKTKQWGGYRPGAGRHTIDPATKRKVRTVSANNEEWEWLKPAVAYLKAHPDIGKELAIKQANTES